MSLTLIWTFFINLMSFFGGFEDLYYVVFSVIMLYLTYFWNRIYPIQLPVKLIIILLLIPSIIFWYIVFVYNDFLCLTPMSYECFTSVALIHLSMMSYIFFKY